MRCTKFILRDKITTFQSNLCNVNRWLHFTNYQQLRDMISCLAFTLIKFLCSTIKTRSLLLGNGMSVNKFFRTFSTKEFLRKYERHHRRDRNDSAGSKPHNACDEIHFYYGEFLSAQSNDLVTQNKGLVSFDNKLKLQAFKIEQYTLFISCDCLFEALYVYNSTSISKLPTCQIQNA